MADSPRFFAARPFILLASVLVVPGWGCSPATPDQDNPSHFGGATSQWPPPSTPLGPEPDQQDNPWLDGVAGAAAADPALAAPPSETLDALGGSAGATTAAPPQAVLSHYWEGPDGRKMVGILNLNATMLSECEVAVHSNGSRDPWRTLTIEGVSAHQNRTLCIPSNFHPQCTDEFTGSAFNGDDALTLTCDGQLLDGLGQVGHDPGDAWTRDELSTRDSGLFRCGDPDPETTSPETLEGWRAWSPFDDEDDPGACPPSDPPGVGGAGGMNGSLD